MYLLCKEFRFEASHLLPFHAGKCRRLHGHSWVGQVILLGEDLATSGSSTGMLVDFGEVGKVLDAFVEAYLDHRHLNDSTGLESPTSELLAKWIYEQLKPLLPMLAAVRIKETCTCSAEYRP